MFIVNVLTRIMVLVIGLGLCQLAYTAPQERLPEVRILIDTSGSMAENDPDNIRAPALRMLAKILPKGADAGVWIFDTTAQSIIPVGKVNKAWVSDAESAADEIHSEGYHTNIGDALEKAVLQWSEADYEAKRNIILLTDGIVDVSDNEWENEEAKTHIFETLLPRLQEMNIHLHTIALSDQADAKLLEKMALGTDGLYAKIQDSEELQRVFLKLFERSFKKDSLPIEENKFVVDDSVEEITLLVFRKSKQDNIKIKRPNQKVFYKFSYPKNVHWFREAAVDMVTITKPETGKWTIVGNVDPDNRVMIISDLGLDVTPLPANIFAGEEFVITTSVTEQGKPINSQKFLKYIDLEMSVETEGLKKEIMALNDEGTNHDALKNDGIFTTKLGPIQHLESPLDSTINVTLKSNTFHRQVTQRVRLLPVPIALETLTKVSDQGKILMSIDVRPNLEILKDGTLIIEAITKDDNGRVLKRKVEKYKEGIWRLELSPTSKIGQYETKFKIAAQTVAGRKVTLNSDPVILAVPEVTLPKPKLPQGVSLDQLQQEANKLAEESKGSLKWLLIGLLVLVVNAGLGAGGYFLYKKMVKKRQAEVHKLAAVLDGPNKDKDKADKTEEGKVQADGKEKPVEDESKEEALEPKVANKGS